MDKQHGVVNFAKENSKVAIANVANLYARQLAGEKVTEEEFRADAYAADAAADAYAAYAAAYAAYAAADAAADAAARGHAAWRGARADHRKAQADKLIELIAAAPVLAAA